MTCGEPDGHVVIAGGSGFLGVSLANYLAAIGTRVVILSRSPLRMSGPWKHAAWDARSLGEWRQELNGARALVNLAGRSVDCIKTPDHQDEILRSRVEATRVLGEAVRSVDTPPRVWVQMSTAHIYGDPPEVTCDEDSAFGVGLAPFVGRAWEETFAAAALPEQRGVVLRTSFVIGRNQGAGGGALGVLKTLARLGLAGTIASGKQGMSWIHEADLNRLFDRAITNGSMQGAYLASAPQPVSQAQFMRELRRAVGMPLGLPAPGWLVRLGGHFLLRTDPELILFGRYVVSRRLREEGFEFQFPNLQEALRDLLGTKQSAGVTSAASPAPR
jgi:hypothetical protein